MRSGGRVLAGGCAGSGAGADRMGAGGVGACRAGADGAEVDDRGSDGVRADGAGADGAGADGTGADGGGVAAMRTGGAGIGGAGAGGAGAGGVTGVDWGGAGVGVSIRSSETGAVFWVLGLLDTHEHVRERGVERSRITAIGRASDRTRVPRALVRSDDTAVKGARLCAWPSVGALAFRQPEHSGSAARSGAAQPVAWRQF